MKIRATITDRSWAHKLHAKQSPNGTYYVQLLTQGGSAFPHGKIIGGFESIDWIFANARALYAELLVALPADAAPLATVTPEKN